MDLVELKKKYKKIPLSILKSYKKADRYVVINDNDRDLDKIKIVLPKPPMYHLIENFGLHAREQYFVYEEYPKKLQIMVNDLAKAKRTRSNRPSEIFLTVEEIWKHLELHRYDYEDEIEWIKKQWYYRFNGKWYFINGKPTYLCGWNWFYLNYYYLLDGSLPLYRDRDRRWFHAQWYLYNETVDENGIDHKQRLHRGTNNLDYRRSGKSSRACSIFLNVITANNNFIGGIQGLDKNNGETMFRDHIIYDFKKLPFFFKPAHEGSTDSKAKLALKPGAVVIGGKGTIIDDRDSLDSYIDFAPTSDRSYYDKKKIHILLIDEAGKTKNENVELRHDVIKECVAQGTNIIGWMIYTTTVEETTKEAMKSFKKICNRSHYGERENGSTVSGLVNVFIPAHDGLEGFIDEYGNSVITTPKKPIKGIDGKMIYIGSEDELKSKRRRLRAKRHFDALAGEKRRFPMCWRDCFTPAGDDVNFNREILETRIGELEFGEQKIIRGNLEWVTGNFGDVKFVADLEGRWYISRKPLENERNNYYTNNEIYYPKNSRYTIGADPFKFSKTKGRRQSKGGLTVILDYDEKIDPKTKDINSWVTHDIVATYEYRPPTTKEFAEDALKACIYWSAMMYSERNVPVIIDRFLEWGYGGYLLYDLIPNKQGFLKVASTPGFNTTGGEQKQKLMRNIKDYIQLHGMRCKHLEFLQDCVDIAGIEDMTNYDRFTSTALALEGTKSKFKSYRDDSMNDFDLGDIY